MDQIYLMTVFIAVAEEQSLAAAARRLNLSPIAVTRAVCAMEEQLGTQLVLRAKRSARLTAAGERYVATLKDIIAGLADADSVVVGYQRSHMGQLSVAAPVQLGKHFVMPCISEYMRCFPGVQVSVRFCDRLVNLVEEGLDVAIQIGRLPNSRLKAICVGRVSLVMCAAPSFLDRCCGSKASLDPLQSMIVTHTETSRDAVARNSQSEDANPSTPRPRLTVTSDEAAAQAALAGIGIARLWSYQAAPYIVQGRLKIVRNQDRATSWPVQVLHREGKYGSLKVRSFIDMLVKRLRNENRLH